MHARDGGVAHIAELAAAYCGPDRTELGQRYLRDNIKYVLGEREESGLRTFYRLAEKHGLIERAIAPAFFGA